MIQNIRSALAAIACLGVVVTASAATSTLYVTDMDTTVTDPLANPYGVSLVSLTSSQWWQSGPSMSVIDSWRHPPLIGSELRDGFFRGPIAVADGRIDVLGPYSHAYSTSGTLLGSTLCTGHTNNCYMQSSWDGTTDGNYNYSLASPAFPIYKGDRTVWRSARDWTNGSALFELPIRADEAGFGITYDRARNTLWVQVGPASGAPGDYRVLEMRMDGTVASQLDGIQLPGSQSPLFELAAGALAMDYADETLWWVPLGSLPAPQTNFYSVAIQFDRSGRQLGHAPMIGCAQATPCWPYRPVYGAEFELMTVPEPPSAAIALVALAAVGALRRRR